MSLIGPRPEREQLEKMIIKKTPNYLSKIFSITWFKWLGASELSI